MKECLKADLKQSKPFSSVEEEVFISLQRTADQLAGSFAVLLKPYGISATQFNVLRILRGAGPNGLMCGDIADRMITRDPDITRLLDRMEKAGWIERARNDKDRRVVLTRITTSGRELLSRLDKPVANFHIETLGHMDEKRLRTLLNALNEARHPEARD